MRFGSEEEAKKRIYNVSCERYLGFGCEIDEETSTKLEGLYFSLVPLMLAGDKEYSKALLCLQTGLPGVLFVLPDSYVDPENKDYGGNCYFASAIDIANF